MLVKQGMTLLDAAMCSAGSAENFFAFAALNQLPYTYDVKAGDVLLDTGLTFLQSVAINTVQAAAKATQVAAGQTLADMVIQTLGSMESIFALAVLNGLAFSDDLTPGQTLNCSLATADITTVKTFADKGLKPASSTTSPGQQPPEELQGIGYWIIQNNFIVS